MDKGASSSRLSSSRPVSPRREVTIEIEICKRSVSESVEVECRRDTNSRAASSPSAMSITHSLIPSRPMQSSLLVKVRSSQENFKISSALTDAEFSPGSRRIKVIFTALKLFSLREDSATCLRRSS